MALRFIRTVRDKGDVNLDIGARGRDGTVQYFGRVRARYSWELGDDWTADVANNYFHYNKSGFENTLSFDVRRPLFDKDNLFFRTFTDFFWEKGQKAPSSDTPPGCIGSLVNAARWRLKDRRLIIRL